MPGSAQKKLRVTYGPAGMTPPALAFRDAEALCAEDKLGLQGTKNIVQDGKVLRVPDPVDPRQRHTLKVASQGDSIAVVVAEYIAAEIDGASKKRAATTKRDRRRRLMKWFACKPHDGSIVPKAVRDILMGGNRAVKTLEVRDIYNIMTAAQGELGDGSALRLLWQVTRSSFLWTATAGRIAPDKVPLPVGKSWGQDEDRNHVLSPRDEVTGEYKDGGVELRATIGGVMACSCMRTIHVSACLVDMWPPNSLPKNGRVSSTMTMLPEAEDLDARIPRASNDGAA